MRVRLTRVALLALCVACCVHLRSAYRHESALSFYFGLCGLALLGWVAGRVDPRLKSPQFEALLKRLAVVCLLLPAADFGYATYLSLRDQVTPQSEVRPIFSYEEAQGDPRAFAKWWRTYVAMWNDNKQAIQRETPELPVPYEFIPGSQTTMLDGTIKVNSHGFVGEEFDFDKGRRYRIVAMGSSHTEGPTLSPGDDPWPLILQQRLQSRYGQGIEVVNAGASGYDIENNLYRLQSHVLPLEPDMIVTYFGYNGFKDYSKEFDIRVPPAPVKPRASLLLSKLEYNFRDWLHLTRERLRPPLELGRVRPRLPECSYTAHYRRYIELTRGQGARLVLCNFNMAVTEDSPEEVIRFYELGFPNVGMCIDANRINSEVVAAVAQDESHVTAADVQDNLNGEHAGNYVDLVHMTYQGKSRLAENVLRAIAPLVEEDMRASPVPYEPIRRVSAKIPVDDSKPALR